MSREFRFRAKRVTDGVWVYGGLVMADDFCIIDQRNELYVEEEYKFRGDTHFFRLSGAMCDEDTVGQFTGLHDKNGKEIYEGDILRSVMFKNILHLIVYDEKEAAFMAVQINKDRGTSFENRCHIYQIWLNEWPKIVIGNIHDNPELLEK